MASKRKLGQSAKQAPKKRVKLLNPGSIIKRYETDYEDSSGEDIFLDDLVSMHKTSNPTDVSTEPNMPLDSAVVNTAECNVKGPTPSTCRGLGIKNMRGKSTTELRSCRNEHVRKKLPVVTNVFAPEKKLIFEDSTPAKRRKSPIQVVEEQSVVSEQKYSLNLDELDDLADINYLSVTKDVPFKQRRRSSPPSTSTTAPKTAQKSEMPKKEFSTGFKDVVILEEVELDNLARVAEENRIENAVQLIQIESDEEIETGNVAEARNFCENLITEITDAIYTDKPSRKMRTINNASKTAEQSVLHGDNVRNENIMIYQDGHPLKENPDFNFDNADHRIKKLHEEKKPVMKLCEQLQGICNKYSYIIKDSKGRVSKENDNVAQYMIDIGILIQNTGLYIQGKGVEMQTNISVLREEQNKSLKQELSDDDNSAVQNNNSNNTFVQRKRVPKPRNAEEVLKKKNVCQICGQAYVNKVDLDTHLNRHANSQIVCEICGRGFFSRERYRNHKLSHEQGFFVCSICGAEKEDKSSLIAHVNRHNRERFVCTIEGCQKSYKDRNSYVRHMKFGHTNERPFACDICGKCYKNPNVVASHKWRDHS